MGEVSIPSGAVELQGILEAPAGALGVVVFSHGSGSGRFSTRNRFVAGELRKAGIATLLLDLLTEEEDRVYENRFDIPLLTERLGDAVRFAGRQAGTRGLPVGLFGASTGAASALRVAASMPHEVRAVVSRGGRPDLAGRTALQAVKAPTLLIVGAADEGVIELNEAARDALAHCERQLVLVPRATHLFEEPGTLEEVARLAAAWFGRYLAPTPASAGPRATRR
ncbi:MAG: dienelactone hydrolase family protein [Betaproteobacteria bacterium]|nr:dienelactone hydrolase family protein [Betaproteobacteria bacterium]MDH5221867.1 dienelactone hydrolase family protein [Betaproteobacteria bacterium]MDH5350978.1 dienelactone hydrolase family protein [Betaproteobacteria bacterium]